MTTERSFEYGTLKVTVHKARIRDRVQRDTLIARMMVLDLGERGSRNIFASAVAQSSVEGMAWLSPAASDTEIAAAYEAWMDLDAELYDLWQTELYLVSQPLNDAALLPPDQLTAGDGEKSAAAKRLTFQTKAESVIERFCRVQLGLPIERKELDLANWGLHNPFALVWRNYTRYFNSSFSALPREGGMEDQDADMMDDLDMIGLLVDFHMHRLKPKRGQHSSGDEDETLPVEYGVE